MERVPKLYIETYGCQMNVADSEVVVSILDNYGYKNTEDIKDADLILVNTCSIRDNAEQRVRARLKEFHHLKRKNPSLMIGVIGCMAERLKEKLIEEDKLVDLVVGPDAYRELPNLITVAETGQQAINVILNTEETYNDIMPVRYASNGVSAFVSIMRGCDNFCTYCVVPFTRGRERSRDPKTILSEVNDLIAKGYKEVTLLGQNIDKYNWNEGEENMNFAQLLEKVALLSSELRVRFSTSFPSDMTDEVLEAIAKHKNICNYIHLPVQSGNSDVLSRMKRDYDREKYLERIESIRRIIPDCAISTDIITGFCGETDAEHKDTISLMDWVKFDYAYMFKYSERPDTYAHKKLSDNVSEEVKSSRLNEVIELQSKLSLESNQQDIGKTFEVLVEGTSKRSDEFLFGRNSQNKVIIFPKGNAQIGDYVHVKVHECTSATLKGRKV